MPLPQPTLRTMCQALLGAVIGLILLAAIGWWLAGLTPQWYQSAATTDAAASELGETAEYRLVEEFQKIRPEGDVWRLRIREEAINAWLTARLKQWLAGRGVDWPADTTFPQIHITPAGIELAISTGDIGHRIGRFRVRPVIDNNQLTLQAPTFRLGRLPLPLPTDWIRPTLHESLAENDDLAFLATLLQGESVEAAIPLVDHRHVQLAAITLEPGACIIQASTALDQN